MDSVLGLAGSLAAPSLRREPFRLVLFDDPRAAEAPWAALEAEAGTAYQTRRFLLPWIAHQAKAAGVEARIAVAFDAQDRPRVLLPLGIARRGLLRAVVYLGGRDCNTALPLIAAEASLDEGALRGLLSDYAAVLSPKPDLFQFLNQPRAWKAQQNPLAFASSRLSPSAAYGATLTSNAQAFLAAHDSKASRKKLKSKAAKLEAMGVVSITRAQSVTDIAETIATFVSQKQTRFASRGVDAGIASDHGQAFLTNIATTGALDLYVLRCGARIVAIYGGLPHRGHWHGLINSFDADPEIARCSPGDLLLRRLVTDLIARGMRSFDLGIGEARYKEALCRDTIELVDTIVPLTAPGRVFATMETGRLVAKRAIKQTPWAYALVRRLQGRPIRGD